MEETAHFLRKAILLAHQNVERGERPFGALVVRAGDILASGVNTIGRTKDPTAHAELNAIRAASQRLHSPKLEGCTVYASGHPCPMCLAAMRLSGVSRIVCAYSNEDGEAFGLSTAPLYAELAKPLAQHAVAIEHHPVRLESHPDLYAEWARLQNVLKT